MDSVLWPVMLIATRRDTPLQSMLVCGAAQAVNPVALVRFRGQSTCFQRGYPGFAVIAKRAPTLVGVVVEDVRAHDLLARLGRDYLPLPRSPVSFVRWTSLPCSVRAFPGNWICPKRNESHLRA